MKDSPVPARALAEFLNLLSPINASLNVEVVLKNVLEKTAELLRTEGTSILLLDRSQGRLYFHTATGEKERELKQFSIEVGEGIAGWVARTGQSVFVPDVSRDERFSARTDRKTGFETRSILCVPLKHEGEVIGVIELVNKKGGAQFTADDLFFMETVAVHAANAVVNAQRHSQVHQENQQLKKQLRREYRLVGESPAMRGIQALVQKVSPTASTLLIRGESGTGKEVLARAIHEAGPRAAYPFQCVTCSLFSEPLLESELFGHEKGAFTGATQERAGRFEMANRGTVFLDEIGTLSASTQVKLLRFLQEKEFERVGSGRTIKADVRIMAATNEDLEKAIAQGRFREDLYYRLKVIQIDLPPLRDRTQDIPLLVEHFLEAVCRETGKKPLTLREDVMPLLQRYRWPGNIRELRNVVERAVVLCSGSQIAPSDLPREITSAEATPAAAAAVAGAGGPLSLAEMDRTYIQSVLQQTGGNKTKAARILGISRNRLERKLNPAAAAADEA